MQNICCLRCGRLRFLGDSRILSSGPQASLEVGEHVGSAAPSRFILAQQSHRDQIVNVAQGRVVRALRELRPLLRRQLALEAIEQPVEDFALALVDARSRMALPETGLPQDGASVDSVPSKARPSSRGTTRASAVMSSVPFWVCSRMS